eukprot:TRINITY_DN1395_c0_g1_i1.p1 TRINITY_DN1395_c0_g1~~TRINITY_DN1395_c0_g1_i1.p1  ORF type:complete len:172 (+),score=26.22 TRINITY_DN1395_c0_g1_i1:51-518(+)
MSSAELLRAAGALDAPAGKGSGGLGIMVRCCDEVFPIDLDPGATVRDLREMVQEQLGLAAVTLTFHGQELHDGQDISDTGISSEACIQCEMGNVFYWDASWGDVMESEHGRPARCPAFRPAAPLRTLRWRVTRDLCRPLVWRGCCRRFRRGSAER